MTLYNYCLQVTLLKSWRTCVEKELVDGYVQATSSGSWIASTRPRIHLWACASRHLHQMNWYVWCAIEMSAMLGGSFWLPMWGKTWIILFTCPLHRDQGATGCWSLLSWQIGPSLSIVTVMAGGAHKTCWLCCRSTHNRLDWISWGKFNWSWCTPPLPWDSTTHAIQIAWTTQCKTAVMFVDLWWWLSLPLLHWTTSSSSSSLAHAQVWGCTCRNPPGTNDTYVVWLSAGSLGEG